MKQLPIINCHTRIFTGACAPDYYFKTVLPDRFDRYSVIIKRLLETKTSRYLIERLIIKNRKDNNVKKQLTFLQIGLYTSQKQIFETLIKNYLFLGNDCRFIALTLNLDYLDEEPSIHARIDTQLSEVIEVKKCYPNIIFPFLSIDPRHKKGMDLLNWVKSYFATGAFYGIKMYTSLGYFAFDKSLYQVYEWCEQNNVPIMVHCTRYGSYYTGKNLHTLLTNLPESVAPNDPAMPAIKDLVLKYLNDKKVSKDNKWLCNILLHPLTYKPTLNTFPKLKICFAHVGGDEEILPDTADDMVKYIRNNVDNTNWAHEIFKLIDEYKNIYTDISYSLNKAAIYDSFLIPKLNDIVYQNRILFGTDYFMTEKENSEVELLKSCMQNLMLKFDQIARINTDTYLKSTFYK